MNQIALQPVSVPRVRRYKVPRTETERVYINEKRILTEREKSLRDIAFLTQYMEDLKAGRPVDNVSPSNDPYFLVPENIADWIEGIKDIMAGKGIIVNSIEDIIGEWDI